jgi:hypothetical protein
MGGLPIAFSGGKYQYDLRKDKEYRFVGEAQYNGT